MTLRSHPKTPLALRRFLAACDFAVFVAPIAEDMASSSGFVSARHKASRFTMEVSG